MKKTVLSLVILCVVITAVLMICLHLNTIDLKTLPGKIVMGNPSGKNGIYIYDFKTRTSKILLNDTKIRSPKFNSLKDKILFIAEKEIIEYDMKNSQIKKLFSSADELFDVQYIPYDETFISFAKVNDLYLYDVSHNKLSLIDYLIGSYSWSKDGDHFIFCKSGTNTIYKYYVNSHELECIFSGSDPEYSNNNRYIAYVKVPWMPAKDTVIVRDLETGQEWSFKSSGAWTFKFSPDDKYLAILQEGTSLNGFMGQEIIIWDYKGKKETRLIDNIYSGSVGNFDWK